MKLSIKILLICIIHISCLKANFYYHFGRFWGLAYDIKKAQPLTIKRQSNITKWIAQESAQYVEIKKYILQEEVTDRVLYLTNIAKDPNFYIKKWGKIGVITGGGAICLIFIGGAIHPHPWPLNVIGTGAVILGAIGILIGVEEGIGMCVLHYFKRRGLSPQECERQLSILHEWQKFIEEVSVSISDSPLT